MKKYMAIRDSYGPITHEIEAADLDEAWELVERDGDQWRADADTDLDSIYLTDAQAALIDPGSGSDSGEEFDRASELMEKFGWERVYSDGHQGGWEIFEIRESGFLLSSAR